jgi:hypothetical protein
MLKYVKQPFKFFIGFIGAYFIIKAMSVKYKKMYPKIRDKVVNEDT